MPPEASGNLRELKEFQKASGSLRKVSGSLRKASGCPRPPGSLQGAPEGLWKASEKPLVKQHFGRWGKNVQASPPLSERWDPWGTLGKPLGKQVIP